MGSRLDEEFRLAEENLRAEIKRLKNNENLHHISTWQENIEEIVKSKMQLKNDALLEKEIKHNAQTCNMIRRSLLKYQTECDYAQYEKELKERGLAFHKDRPSTCTTQK